MTDALEASGKAASAANFNKMRAAEGGRERAGEGEDEDEDEGEGETDENTFHVAPTDNDGQSDQKGADRRLQLIKI